MDPGKEHRQRKLTSSWTIPDPRREGCWHDGKACPLEGPPGRPCSTPPEAKQPETDPQNPAPNSGPGRPGPAPSTCAGYAPQRTKDSPTPMPCALLDPGPSGRGYESQAQGLGAGEPESERPGWMLALPCTGCVVSANLAQPPVLICEIGENDCAPLYEPRNREYRRRLNPGT